MAETFFGPWRIVVKEFVPISQPRFVISGSDNADGAYRPQEGVPMGVEATGAEWTVELQIVWGFGAHTWSSYHVLRTTQFDASEGLLVRLDHRRSLFSEITLSLLCISMDPDINPVPTPNPFDFTIPEG
jgi:hypothetical protein